MHEIREKLMKCYIWSYLSELTIRIRDMDFKENRKNCLNGFHMVLQKMKIKWNDKVTHSTVSKIE